MSVEFQDFSIQVKKAVEDKALQWLEKASGEIEAQVSRNSRVDTGQLRGSWKHIVDEVEMKATIGSPLENAIWEEFGKKILCRIKIGQNRLSFCGKYGIIYL